MNSNNSKKCLICQNKNYKAIFSYDGPDEYEKNLGVKKNGYFRKWVQCRKCGFYYSVYSRDKNIIDKIYASFYRDGKTPWRKESTEETFKKVVALPEKDSETKFRVKWIKKNIDNIWEQGLLKKDKSPYRMLDIGGGNGIFAFEFQDANWVSYVIDPNKDSDFIKTKLHIPLIQDYYKSNSFKYKFRLISLNYVLEHQRSPVSFIKDLSNDMAAESFLYIEVPDAICFKLKPAEDDIFNSCHLWMFSPYTLTLMLNSCGFEIFFLNRLKTKRGHFAIMVLAGKK